MRLKHRAACLLFLLAMVIPALANASWTITAKMISRDAHYAYFNLHCVSDGSALTATNLGPRLKAAGILEALAGSSLMVMDVVPGTGAVAPDTTIDVTITNAAGLAVYSETSLSNSANSIGNSMSSDYNQYPPLFSTTYLTISDIGSSGDEVDLYFLVWIE